MAHLPKKPGDIQEPMAPGQCLSDAMFAQGQAVHRRRELPVTAPQGVQLPSNQSSHKWQLRVPEMAWPAGGLSAEGWLFRDKRMHSRQ